MSRKKKQTRGPNAPRTTDYFAELRKAFPDREVTCKGCEYMNEEHEPWCAAQRQGSEQ